MNRLRTPLIILGLVGAVIVAVVVVMVIRLGRGTPVEILVAKQDIEPGTAVEPDMFQPEEIRGMSRGPLSTYVLKDEYLATYNGLPALTMINKGSPLMKAHLPDPDSSDGIQSRQRRITLLLEDPENVVYPLPVSVDQVGNFVVAGDYVDVIFTLGRVSAPNLQHDQEKVAPTMQPPTGGRVTTPTVSSLPVKKTAEAVEVVTTTLTLPLAKVILPNVHVLRVEREEIRSASAAYGASGETTTRTEQGDIVRLYVELTPEDAEVLSFVLHNGELNLPARAEPAGGKTEGYFWEDFVYDVFADRPLEEVCGETTKGRIDCRDLKKDD
jgi:Flp pilus assembly protein CpaB